MTASVQERRQALETAHPVWHPMTLGRALDVAAARCPERPFILTDDRTNSYAEVRECGGELVAPTEVEEVLTQHPAVAQAYVAGVPDERMGEVGCAWVVPEGADRPDPEELIQHCHRHLARSKVPVKVIYLRADQLPTTATGKVQKFRLQASSR